MGTTPFFTFDVTAFRASYPQFASTTTFPNLTLQAYYDTAGAYIANDNYGWLTEAQKGLALNLMTAHLAALSILIAGGETPGLVTSATIDKVTVTLEPPPVKTQFQWWLGLTPYGQQLLAILQVASVGGWFVGGSGTRTGFRGNAGYPRGR